MSSWILILMFSTIHSPMPHLGKDKRVSSIYLNILVILKTSNAIRRV